MFKKKTNGIPETFDTLIGANTIFEGNIESEGIIRVDGKIKGDLNVNGDVYIGNSAVVNGHITANSVHISGTVEGNIHSKGMLRLLSTARLYGDIHVISFVADEGGIFQGKCSMVDVPDHEKGSEKTAHKKSGGNKDYKKSTVLSQIYDEKEKSNELENE